MDDDGREEEEEGGREGIYSHQKTVQQIQC